MGKQMKEDNDIDDKLANAIAAFNKASSWDEFIVNLDLLCISVEEVEKMYSEWLDTNNPFKDRLICTCKAHKSQKNGIDLKCLFNITMRDLGGGKDYCIALPCKVKKCIDEHVFAPDCKVFYTKDNFISISLSIELVEDLEAMHGIDLVAELFVTALYEISMENHNERKKHNVV